MKYELLIPPKDGIVELNSETGDYTYTPISNSTIEDEFYVIDNGIVKKVNLFLSPSKGFLMDCDFEFRKTIRFIFSKIASFFKRIFTSKSKQA